MKETLKHIRSLVDKDIISEYAIGGDIAWLYYLEPTVTFSLEINVLFPEEETSLLELHKWAKGNDFPELKEHILIHSIPVHLSPAHNDLAKEAVENPRRIRLFNTEVNIVSPEYLLATMLLSGRAKDRARALQFYEEAQIDNELLSRILAKYSVSDIMESLNRNTEPESAEVKNGYFKTIFEKKKAWHKDRQNDSFEEKLKNLIKLQELALEIKKVGGREIKPWEKAWIESN